MCFKMKENIYRVSDVEQGGWRVLPIMYCLSTDTLVDLYLLVVLKLSLRTHIWREKIPAEHELDVDAVKQLALNITVTKHIPVFSLTPL